VGIFLGGRVASAWNWPLFSVPCRAVPRSKTMELYLHAPIMYLCRYLHLTKDMDNFIFYTSFVWDYDCARTPYVHYIWSKRNVYKVFGGKLEERVPWNT
jgi:hypothetical protein